MPWKTKIQRMAHALSDKWKKKKFTDCNAFLNIIVFKAKYNKQEKKGQVFIMNE